MMNDTATYANIGRRIMKIICMSSMKSAHRWMARTVIVSQYSSKHPSEHSA